MKKKIRRINGNDLILEFLIGKSLNESTQIAGFNGFSIRVTSNKLQYWMK